MESNLFVWEKEYGQKKLMSGTKPQKSLLNFLRFVKKTRRGDDKTSTLIKVLDLGSGNGKNAVYLAAQGAQVTGMEFSKNAIELALQLKKDKTKEIRAQGGEVNFLEKSIGERFGLPDENFDIILDVTSSNSLNEQERERYLEESARVLKKNGYFFTRGLLKDGDSNAKYLLKNFPGSEKDRYIIPEFNLEERVFSKKDLFSMYQKYFSICFYDTETHYTTYGDRKFKRNFWVLYLQKK